MLKLKKAIRFGRFKEIVLSLCLVVLTALFLSSPAYSEETPIMTLISRVQTLEVRLAEIESDQDLILDKQKEIITKLDNLKVWVRRN